MILLILLNVLNLLDLAFTAYGIHKGYLFEGNPLLNRFGLGWKLIVVPFASWLVYRWKPRALLFPTIVYGAVVLYHIYGLLTYV